MQYVLGGIVDRMIPSLDVTGEQPPRFLFKNYFSGLTRFWAGRAR